MNIAAMIDHTILKPEVGKKQVEKICLEAKKYGFASVCVNSSYVSFCAELLKDTAVKVCTVIGFPLGAMSTAAKAAEAHQAILDGAEELDMVIHIGMLKDGNDDYVERDIRSVVEEANGHAAVKVIIETCLLTEEEKIRACLLAKKAGADFVKTSTGFSTGGAVAEDISLMKKTVGNEMKVKASGGIRTWEKAEEMIQAGAQRIGTSSGIQIVEETK